MWGVTAACAILLACSKPADPVPARTTTELRLLTYNLNYSNPNVGATLDAIVGTTADVLLLQEITREWEQALRSRLSATYPHATFHIPREGAGHAVMSRIPITTDELLSKPEGAFYHGHRLVVTTDGGPVQILHVHLRASIHDDCFRGPCSHIEWVKGQFTTPPVRRREIEAHWKRVDRTLPTIVAGDFNEPDTGDVVAFLRAQGLVRVATVGPPSWHYERSIEGKPKDMLEATIDHVLTDPRIIAVEASVIDAGASDHRPVVARLRLK